MERKTSLIALQSQGGGGILVSSDNKIGGLKNDDNRKLDLPTVFLSSSIWDRTWRKFRVCKIGTEVVGEGGILTKIAVPASSLRPKVAMFAVPQGRESAMPAVSKGQEVAMSAMPKGQEVAMPVVPKGQEVAMSAVSKGQEVAMPAVSRGQEVAMPVVSRGREFALFCQKLGVAQNKAVTWGLERGLQRI